MSDEVATLAGVAVAPPVGKRGHGFGSEDNLRRYISERTEHLDHAVLEALLIGDADLSWMPYPQTATGDREFRGLEFLGDEHADIRAAWQQLWPTRGRKHSWDAIARSGHAWLLVEAKANAPELVSPPCGAQDARSREQIMRALNATKKRLGVHRFYPWAGTYYQHANRLVVLDFPRRREMDAHLVSVYFIGDRFPDGTPCPASRVEWEALIEARRLTLGLPASHALSAFDHHVFLPAFASDEAMGL